MTDSAVIAQRKLWVDQSHLEVFLYRGRRVHINGYGRQKALLTEVPSEEWRPPEQWRLEKWETSWELVEEVFNGDHVFSDESQIIPQTW